MNWIQLLEDYNIPYVTRGPNTKRGEVSVHCPWCGDEDPSEHLGIALEAELWGCHRNGAHRGKSPFKLIQGLLGCSYGQAKLVVAQYDASDPETLDQALAALMAVPEATEKEPVDMEFPTNFRAIKDYRGGQRFCAYLKARGFPNPEDLADRYNLKYTTTGRWKDRIIIPIYSDHKLAAWTARALIKPVDAPRYLSTSDEIKKLLFNEYRLEQGGHLLIVTEGPFDAIKMDYFGSLYATTREVAATCTFGTALIAPQLWKLRSYSRNFNKTVVLFDGNAQGQGMELADFIPGAVLGSLPANVDDPGALTPDQVRRWVYQNR